MRVGPLQGLGNTHSREGIVYTKDVRLAASLPPGVLVERLFELTPRAKQLLTSPEKKSWAGPLKCLLQNAIAPDQYALPTVAADNPDEPGDSLEEEEKKGSSEASTAVAAVAPAMLSPLATTAVADTAVVPTTVAADDGDTAVAAVAPTAVAAATTTAVAVTAVVPTTIAADDSEEQDEEDRASASQHHSNPGMDVVRALLVSFRLETYADEFEEFGYATLLTALLTHVSPISTD